MKTRLATCQWQSDLAALGGSRIVRNCEIAGPTDALLGYTMRSDSGLTEYLFQSKLGVGGTAAAYLVLRMDRVGSSPAVIKVILPQIVEAHGDTPKPCS